jgi:metallo-beta-lactamase class B
MLRRLALALLCAAGCGHVAPAGATAAGRPAAAAGGAATAGGTRELGDDVVVSELVPGVWLHVTYRDAKRAFTTNGLLVEGAGASLLLDSGWTDAQAERLWAFAAARGRPIVDAVITHAHDDRIGGVFALERHGVRVHALAATIAHARERGQGVPDQPLASPTTLTVGGVRAEVWFPGAGHEDDNTVVWLPDSRILYGGCLVKSARAADLGNLSDANLAAWPAAVRATQERYPNATQVIPGHDALGGDPLAHTLELLAAPAKH